MPTRVREDRVQVEGQTSWPLKNGYQVELRRGMADYQSLGLLFEKDSSLFQALLTIAQGRPHDVSTENTAALRNGLYLLPDFSMREDLRNVLLSAYQETPDGCVLVNPFRLESTDQAGALEHMEKAALERLLRLIGGDKDEGRSGGRQ